jgi:RNA polymerase sigma-70 factor (ECF subfamily)
MSELATGNRDDALDLVQDAMVKLIDKYATRDPQEWGPLFYRILQRRILDWHRRNTVRRRVLGFIRRDDGGDGESLENYPDGAARPLDQLVDAENLVGRINPALRALPVRQQQVFMLRLWEGLSVKQTAAAMGCSQGSVKTHYSRAMKTLRSKLGGLDHEYK